MKLFRISIFLSTLLIGAVYCILFFWIFDNKDINMVETYRGLPLVNHTHHDLLDARVPSRVLYIWCGKRQFKFANYLSIMSGIRILKPDNIYFLHETYPVYDKDYGYMVDWLNEITRQYPFLWLKTISGGSCSKDKVKGTNVILNELRTSGGVYVHENTILTPRVKELLNETFVYALDRVKNQGFIVASKGKSVPDSIENVDTNLLIKKTQPCLDSAVLVDESAEFCVNIQGSISAGDIWQMDGALGRLSRLVAYGNTSRIQATPDYSDLAPNIAHYMWHGKGPGTMDLMFYLSVLSVLHIGEVDTVYIHGEAPTGPYWERIKNNRKVIVKYREKDTIVYNQRVNEIHHISDIGRLDVVLKYGGLYLDIDVLVMQPLSPELRAYPATMTYPYRDTYDGYLQNSLMLGKPGAKFFHEYLETMRTYKDDLWSWNSCFMPYKVKERYPESLHIDPRFLVNCLFFKESFCRKTGKPGDPNPNANTILREWRSYAFGYHFPAGTPKELGNAKLLKTSKSMFAEMGRFVLERAGETV